MSVIVTRNGKGSPLTFTEADANFENLNNDKYEQNDSPTFNVITGTSYVGLPVFDGTNDGIVPAGSNTGTQFLRDDGVFAAAGGGAPGGSDTQIQFNDSGALGGDADFTWDKTNNVLTFGNSARISGPMAGAGASTELAVTSSVLNGDSFLNIRPNGTSGNAGLIVWGASTGSTSYGFISYQSSTVILDTSSGIPLSFRCGGGQIARFFPGGNVIFGTGTVDPSISFKVEGAAEFASTIQGATRVGINNTNSGSYNASLNQLVVGSASGNQGITIASGTAAYGQLGFADGTTGDQAYRGIISYNHADDSLGLWTSATERVNISGAGVVLVSAPTSGTTDHQIAHTNGGSQVIGYRDIPQNSRSADYTLTLADAAKHIFHPSADTTARTFTIPANSSVAFPVGTAITFVNQNAAGVITIAITTDTMRLAGPGTTGSRTLAANGIATALKITSTEWIISGTGLT